MIPVRINQENYKLLKSEADAQHRSVTGQLNKVLDERYGRQSPSIEEQEKRAPSFPAGERIKIDPLEPILAKKAEEPITAVRTGMRFCKHGAVVGFCKKGCK